MTTFTVFTATYNRAGCLKRVFDSLTQQTYHDFEWLIVDDGSVDETQEVVKTFQATATFPIRYIRKGHEGKPAAWNLGVSEARGGLFVSADSDDAFLPQSLERLLAMWETIPIRDRNKFRGGGEL